ncbi:unnamed protein product [Urochloa decumbens]|uniref:F-box domain-containing protein n=1 Tax=Urochloa decumbens TaxID=240449 RepID=A0ABC8WCY1_9POAL
MVGSDEKRLRACLAAAIPDDLLIYEVLVHLRPKSLARCRCVSRSWRAAIAGAAFVRRHLELSRARPPSSVLAVPREIDPDDDHATSTEISFHRLPLLPPPPPQAGSNTTTDAELVWEKAWPEGITRWLSATHCDGLVAIATATDRVFVCNPATRELVALPLGAHNAELEHCDDKDLVPQVALGFDQWRNRYVVSRYFYRVYGEMILSDEVTCGDSKYCRRQGHDIGHEVFTLGGGGGGESWEWELTQDPPHAIGGQRPVCTRRGIYWHSDVARRLLMRFGLRDRTFHVVPRPPAGWSCDDEMVNLDGKLCYVHAATEASIHVWLADDGSLFDELQWSLRWRIDLHSGPNRICYLRPVISNGEDKLLLYVAGENSCDDCLSWCTVSNNTVEKTVEFHNLRYGRPDGSKYMVQSLDVLHYNTFPYFESLVSLTACNY